MATDTVRIVFEGTDKGVESTVDGIEKSLKNLKTQGTIALAGITTAMDKMAISFVKGGIAYDAQIETYLTRLTTLTGSAEKANEVLEQIKKDALKTPFDVSSLTQAESLLLATGMSANEARDDILALGDAVSASGGGNAELQRMAVNLQQIKNVGKASALDIKQFAYAGIDIYGLLADSMGITRAEASKMDITYDMLSQALQKASKEGGKYYGAMEEQSKTYNGAMSNLKESIDVLKGEVAKDLFNAIKKIIPVLTQMFDWLGKNHQIVEAIAIPLLVFFNTIMAWLAIKKVILVIKALNATLLANPVMLIVAGILALIAVLVYLYNHCEGFRKIVNKVFNAVKKVVITFVNLVKKYVQFIWKLIQMYIDLVIKYVKFMWNIITTVFNAIKTVIQFVINAIINYIKMWITIIKTVVDAVIFVKDKVVETFNNIKKAVEEKIKAIIDFIKKKIDKIVSSIKERVSKFLQVGKDLINALWEGITSVWEGFKKWIEDKADIITGLFDWWDKFVQFGEDLINGIKQGVKNVWGGFKSWIGKKADAVVGFFKNPLGIHSPSTVMADTIGKNLVLGIEVGFGKELPNLQKMINSSFNLSPTLSGTANTHLSPQVNVVVNNNMKTDPLGQVVNKVKTFSGGAKNDYNYGYGG